MVGCSHNLESQQKAKETKMPINQKGDTTTQHTPGPWELITHERHGETSNLAMGVHIPCGKGNGQHITFIQYDRQYPDMQERDANARLIAAAPEMKKELITLRQDKAELVKVIQDKARRFDHCANQLAANVRPGHPDYISKGAAADVLHVLVDDLKAVIAKTTKRDK